MLQYNPILSLFTDTCTIYDRVPVTKANGATGFTKSAVVTDQRCRVSFGSGGHAGTDRNLTTAETAAVLFIPAKVNVDEGADVDVFRGARTYHFKAAGVPRVYDGHTEIDLLERDKA